MLRLGDKFLRGVDRRTDPERLSEGFARQLTNFLPDGAGSMVSRAGFQGQFTTPLAGPLYGLTAFEVAASTTIILFVSGGKLYKTTAGSNTYTEILNAGSSFALANNGRDVMMVRYGKYVYGVDGSGPLFRTDTTTGETVTGLTAPASAPTARLLAAVLDTMTTASDWSPNPAPSAYTQLLTNPSFETIVPSDLTGWTHAGTIESHTSNSDMVPVVGSRALLLDEPDNLVYQDVTPPLVSGSASVRSRVFRLTTVNHTADDAGRAAMIATVTALDGSGVPLAAVQETFQRPAQGPTNQWAYDKVIANFGSLSVEPTSIRAHLQGGNENPPGTADGWYVDDAELQPIWVRLTVAATATSGVLSVSVAATDGTNPEPLATFATAGCYVKRTYGSDQAWNAVSRLSIPIQINDAVVATFGYPRFRIGLQENGSSTIQWTGVCEYNADKTAISADLTTLDASGRDHVQYLYLQLLDDLPSEEVWGDLFTFGPIDDAGALAVGYAYSYRYSEYRQITGVPSDVTLSNFESLDNVQSSGSPLSAQIVAEKDRARVELTIPAKVNGETTHIIVWREGGPVAEQDDTDERIVAIFPDGSSTSDTTTGWDWNTGTRKFTDNVSDGLLFDRRVYQVSRDNPPSGASDIALFQNRLWLAKGNQLYASWLLTEGAEYGLYTSLLNFPDDPQGAVKGFRVGLSTSQDPDGIVGLLPFGTALLALRGHSVNVVTGFDPSNFAVQSYLAVAGIGGVARRSRAIVVIDGQSSQAWFQSATGVQAFNADSVLPKSLVLEPELKAANLDATTLQRSAMVFHDRRLWLLTPGPGDTTGNTTIWVWDPRPAGDAAGPGWTKLLPPAGVRFTGGLSLSGPRDGQALFLAGDDGQLYKYAGTVDKALPTTNPGSGIALTFESRRYCEAAEGLGRDYKAIELWARVAYSANADVAVSTTWYARGGNPIAPNTDGALWQDAVLVYGGERNHAKRTAAWVRGRSLEVQMTATVSGQFALRAVGLDAASGTVTRKDTR